MRIGLDLHVVDGLFQGSRSHVIELFSRVVRLCPEFLFFGFLDDTEKFMREYPVFRLPNFEAVRLPGCGPVRRLAFELPRLQRRLKLDLLHTQYIIPLPSLSHTVVTIHDILFETHPQYFSRFFRARSQILMRRAANRSLHVFTVSEFSSKEIRRIYEVEADRLTVIPNGVDSGRFFPGDADAALLAGRGLRPGRFLLSVGRLEPRKNHLTLLRAYVRLGKSAPPLVLVGQRDFGFDALFEELRRDELRDRVLLFEDVSDRELPAFYRNCSVFIYPSLAEGFGMPPLEAMASGVPVIAADNTALSEVVGAGGLLVPSRDVEALESAMRRLLEESGFRTSLVAAGLKVAASFSWETSAGKVSERYRLIARQREQ